MLGVDIGASSCKAIVFDADRNAKGRAQQEYSRSYPNPGWVELDANSWWNAVTHPPQPVHVNLPFREPLVPTGETLALGDRGPAHAGTPTAPPRSTPEDVLKQADILALHMNLTEENRGFLNRERLALMNEEAIVVNASRGALIDQEAVAEAVKSGRLAGYAADVVDPEPIRPDNPLIGLERVVLTPHIGSRTYESVVRQATMAVQNLINVLSGRPALAQKNMV